MTCPGFLLGWFGGFFSKWFVLLRTKFKAPGERNNNQNGCTSCKTFYFNAEGATARSLSSGVKRHSCSLDRHRRNSNPYKGYKYKSLRRRKRVRISGVLVMLQILCLWPRYPHENNNLCTTSCLQALKRVLFTLVNALLHIYRVYVWNIAPWKDIKIPSE